MIHNRTSKVLLCLILFLAFAIPAGIVSASQNNISHAQSSFIKYGPGNGSTVTSTSPTLAWGTSSGATSYQYCYDTVNNNLCDNSWTSTGTSTTAPLTNLSNNTTYYWQIRASGPSGSVDANGGTWWAFTVSVVPPTATPAPFGKATPANGVTNQSLTLITAWSSNPGAVRYEYCYDTNNNGVCDSAWVNNGTTQYVYYSGLSYSTTYWWQVRAVDVNNNITYADNFSWWSFTTMPAPTPTRTATRTPTPTISPAFVKYGPSNGSSTSSTTIVWGSSYGVSQYQYCYDTSNNNNCDSSWTSNGTSSVAPLSGLSTGTTYYWEARAINGSGVTTYADGGTWWSFTLLATPTPTPTATPVAFVKISPANGSVQSNLPVIQWSASSGATTYEWCIDTILNSTCDTTWHPIASQVDFPSGLSHTTTYQWQVRAIGPGGAITYANSGFWWTFTTN